MKITREHIDKIGAILFAGAIIFLALFLIIRRESAVSWTNNPDNLREASYYETLADGRVHCLLCPNNCVIDKGDVGSCQVRKNIDGKLYSLVYGKIASRHLDPIEKKPLYHFLPGSKTYSIATAGCNLQCKFCQNWSLSQQTPEEVEYVEMTPQEVVDEALASGAESIAYTYNEPTVFFEFMLETAKLAHENGLKNVWVTCGYINPEPLQDFIRYLDAANVDIKGFSEEFYQKLSAGRLQPVLDTVTALVEADVHVEITNLIIPGENDSDEMLEDLLSWMRENMGADAVLHFSRFHPDYQLVNTPPTPLETLEKARRMAFDAGLRYVYIGNIADSEANTTFCQDGSVAIQRDQYFVTADNLDQGVCQDGTKIPGVWR